jgi:4'-phosphopantetheinyl transferase
MDLLWPPATKPPSLGAGEAHIWAVPIDVMSRQQNELRKVLSVEEQARADEFRFDEPAKRFIATRAALRLLLGQYLAARPVDIQFSTQGNNKPRLASIYSGADLRFNVSHSGSLALVAVTVGNEIGVDIEHLRDVSHLEQIAGRYFHTDEIAAILSAEPTDRSATFLRCWTAKEAVLKAIGIGITSSLETFAVPPTDSFEGSIDLSRLQTSDANSRCSLARLVPHRDYLAAVAVMNARPRLLCHTFVM